MFFTKKGFIILSAELTGHHLNESRTQDLRSRLKAGRLGKSINFVECNGVYKGTKEKSFMVEVENHYDFMWTCGVARSYNQESILMVDKRNQASLFYLESKKVEKLGTFHKIPKSVADTLDAYTETKDGYYAC